MEYLAIVYNNSKAVPSNSDWENFFELARKSGMFQGGSGIGKFRMIIGEKINGKISNEFVGYMRFKAEKLDALMDLLKSHPVIISGGSLELVDLPRS